MGGVNGNRNYATTMGFGSWDAATGLVVVERSLLQGGIVRSDLMTVNSSDQYRWLSTIFPEPSSVLC